jgi:hypothetical protein
VQKKHNDADDQHDVDETGGNVKGQKPKQPENNKNRSD